MKKRIIIFDDDSTRRDSLAMLLNMCHDMECVGSFESAANAVAVVKDTEPDLVLMDIDMPLGNGINGTRVVKAEFPGLPIIMQT
ncbi:MAG: response regulator transcription factor, partial [Chitinophagaceae bacterium]